MPRFTQISSVYSGFNTNSYEKQVFEVAFYCAFLKYIVIKYQVEKIFILLLNVQNVLLVLQIHYIWFITQSTNI